MRSSVAPLLALLAGVLLGWVQWGGCPERALADAEEARRGAAWDERWAARAPAGDRAETCERIVDEVTNLLRREARDDAVSQGD